MRSFSRNAVLGASLFLLASGLAACPAPKLPKGPAPEYEDPPAPSWLEAGTAPAATIAPSTSIAPAPADAGATD
jgi:hypothetical protein